ncbi:MAG TPA: flavin reductase family protein [Rugosimonospora sp.]|nr:flavin reductase family protein [Rugosimonospora sp.]
MDRTRETILQDPGVLPPAEFRKLMAGWPTGVCVVTSAAGELPVGCTVNTLATVSLEPPTAVVSLAGNSATLGAVREHGLFGVNVISHRDYELGHRFARVAREERFTGVAYTWTLSVPLLDVAHLRSVYRVEHWLPVSDHVLIVGRLLLALPSAEPPQTQGGPAVRYEREYWRLCPAEEPAN